MNFKLSVSLLALKKIDDLEIFLSILRSNSIRYIELPITKVVPRYIINEKKIITFKKTLKKYGIKVSSSQAVFYKKNLNILNKLQFSKNYNHLLRVIKICEKIGIPNIIFGSPMNRKKNQLLKKEADRNFSLILKKIDKILYKKKINFLIEPNAKYYKCDYLNTVNEVLNLLKANKFKKIFINLDTGNFLLENDKIFLNKSDKKYFKNFQVSEKNLTVLSNNTIKHKKILKKFNLNNKFISLEMLNIDIRKLNTNIKKLKIITKNI